MLDTRSHIAVHLSTFLSCTPFTNACCCCCITLRQELVARYRAGGSEKIEACNSLLDIIKDSLKAVTVSAPSWSHLQMLWAVRRLYQPEGVRLPPKLAVVLIRRFAEAYEQVKDDPEVTDVAGQVMAYNALLKTYGLRDHQVRSKNKMWDISLYFNYCTTILELYVNNICLRVFYSVLCYIPFKQRLYHYLYVLPLFRLLRAF